MAEVEGSVTLLSWSCMYAAGNSSVYACVLNLLPFKSKYQIAVLFDWAKEHNIMAETVRGNLMIEDELKIAGIM